MEIAFGDKILQFDIFKATKGFDCGSIDDIDYEDNLIEKSIEIGLIENPLEATLTQSTSHPQVQEVPDLFHTDTNLDPSSANMILTGLDFASVSSLLSNLVPPQPELKQLLNNLKYIFLGPNQTLPVIINAHLT
jgi:hypothetical protein